MTFVVAACGARLTPEERATGIRALTRAGAGIGAAATGQAAQGALGATAGGEVAGAAAAAGGATAPVGKGGTTPNAARASNGGATDVGVTRDQITIATIADVSGIQPGLFRSAWQAVHAYTEYQNSLGGIYGRKLKFVAIDDQTNAGGNRSAVLDVCKKAFALVGSMSAFDDGGAEAVDQCGIPDISAITVNPPRIFAKMVYPAFPNRADQIAIGPANYVKQQHPEAIKHAAMLYLDAGVTRINARQRVKGYETVGFNFEYVQSVQVLEANYAPYVLQMRNQGIQYVDMVSDYQSIVRLLKAMRQQNWRPEVLDWDSVVYSPNFLTQAEGAADGSQFFLTTTLFEEAANNPEMQLYFAWLRRVAPGAEPDFFGIYAWSAARLFTKAALTAGPKLTRKGLLAALRAIHAWDGNGLHAAHDIGGKHISPCFLYGEVKKDAFRRLYPSSGFQCNLGGVVKVPL